MSVVYCGFIFIIANINAQPKTKDIIQISKLFHVQIRILVYEDEIIYHTVYINNVYLSPFCMT